MAMTHHYIVQLAALRCGHKARFEQYVLLGDDIMIADKAVAESYLALLSTLDMRVSEQKTHVSLHAFEFAKRWFFHGVEITGFSIGGLLIVRNSYSLLHNFLVNQATHG